MTAEMKFKAYRLVWNSKGMTEHQTYFGGWLDPDNFKPRYVNIDEAISFTEFEEAAEVAEMAGPEDWFIQMYYREVEVTKDDVERVLTDEYTYAVNMSNEGFGGEHFRLGYISAIQDVSRGLLGYNKFDGVEANDQ